MDKKFPPDHFLTGMLIAVLSIGLSYLALTQFALWWEHGLKKDPILQPPLPQMLILVSHIIAFRQFVVTANRYATGIGFFIVLFVVSMYYIFTHSGELLHI
jgi:hypothetical protein